MSDHERPASFWTTRIRARLAGAAPIDDEVVEEIAQHAEQVYRTARADGLSADQATARIDAEMDDLPALARAARAARVPRPAPLEPPPPGALRPLAIVRQDVAYGVRMLMARPSFAAIAILTLALGIGANTAIFSVVYAVLLAPLPFPQADRLVMLWESDANDESDAYIVSAPNWQDWSRQSTSFDYPSIWEDRRFNLTGGAGEPEMVSGLRASASVFPMLGVAPALGRAFTPEEDAPGHDVVVIADGLWRGRFGARPDVIGQTMRINGRPFEIIGVMPPAFKFLRRRTMLWVPIAFNDRDDPRRGSHSFGAGARLKAGVSFDAARAEMRAIGRRLEQQYPENRGEGVTMTRLADLDVRALRPTLLALAAAVGLVLLIACVNVANLLLAQAAAREREFAIRSALGAGRARLASQLLMEGLLLAMAGGGLGLAIAWAGTAALANSLPASIASASFREVGTLPLSAPMLAFTFATATLTGVLFSLVPLVRMSGMAGHHSGASLKASGGRGGTARFGGLRSALMAVEVALAIVVLASAGLMVRSMAKLMAVDPGLDPSRVLLTDIALPQEDLYGPPVRTGFCDAVQRAVAPLPGITAVGAISHLPLSGANAGRGFAIEGRAYTPDDGPSAAYRLTCPGYFTTLGIPILRGRDFSAADATTAPGVVILNESAAARYWPGEDPLGRRLKLGGPDSPTPWLTVVGVVKDVHHFGLDRDARREMFRPYSQAAWPSMTVTVKTASDPLVAAAQVRAALTRIDPDQPVSRMRTMEDVIEDSTGARRFPMLLLSLFSAVAVLLAAVGVYGVVSYLVSQRTREIGIRMALGARAGEVVHLILSRSLLPIAAGIAAGVAGSLGASRLLASLLFRVTPGDPLVLAAIVLILGTAAVGACLVPARRAASVDPLIVLKEE